MKVQDIVVAMGFKIDESFMADIKKKIISFKDFAKKSFEIDLSFAKMNELAEEFSQINRQIRSAMAGFGDQREIQEKILKSANDTRMAYADTAGIISGLMQGSGNLFGNVDEAIVFYDAVAKTLKEAGRSNGEIAGFMEMISQSFADGKVNIETLSQLMEMSPEAVEYLNRRLGSTTDQLQKMVTNGKVSLFDLKDAFTMHADEISQKFDGMDHNISNALLNIRNRWGYWLDDINSGTGLTDTLAEYMIRGFDIIVKGLDQVRDLAVKVTEKFGGMENILRVLGIAAGIAIASFKGKEILELLKSLCGLLNIANLKAAAIVSVILGIALIVDDFINFMQGNNSVIGEMMSKMGLDAEEERDRIIAIWEGLKGILSVLWSAISQIAVSVFNSLEEFWNKWGEKITAVFSAVFQMIGGIFSGCLEIIQGVVDLILGIFSEDWAKAWEGIYEVFAGTWKAIAEFFTGIWEIIYVLFGEKINNIVEMVAGFVGMIRKLLEEVGDFFSGIGDYAKGFLEGVVHFFGGEKALPGDGNDPFAMAGFETVQNATMNNTVGGSRNSNVRQDVKINNTFYGTDQKTISGAAIRSAEDTTAQLARGLAFGI